jgi:hypothetical protein
VKLVALTATKIEGDIVEAFVRHTLAFVDRIVVVDNASLDDTRALIDALIDEGLPITVWDGEALTASPHRRTENARRALAEFGCDYLLLLDVDEFVVAPSRVALEREFAALPDGANALIAMRTYVPTADDDPDEVNPIARIRHRLAVEATPFFKVVIARSFLDHREAIVIPGNHAVVDSAGGSTSVKISWTALAHFPVRSMIQLQSKALLGWPRFLAMGFNEVRGLAHHWLRLNEALRDDADWTLEKYLDLANHYQDDERGVPELVLDPLPAPECRYTHVTPSPLAIAIAFTRQVAQAYAAVTLENRRLRNDAPDRAQRKSD